jgi:hypothetical protein
MSTKYIKCFDNREAHGNGCAFEQVSWCKTLKEAEKQFGMDVKQGWANEQGVNQYIFKLVKIQTVKMDIKDGEIVITSKIRKVR